MIHRKLLLTNTIIIILTMALITTVSFFTMRRTIFKENVIIYEARIENAYDSLREEFSSAEDFVLHVCTSWNLINLLNEGLPDRYVLKDTVTAISYGNEYESLVVLPVIGQDVYVIDEETGAWDRQSNVLQYYPHDYEFEWHFRPDGKPCYRVMKAMHSQKEDNAVIAIVYVDVALTSLADEVYSFSSYSELNGEMYLLDENGCYLIPYHLKGDADFPADTGLEFVIASNEMQNVRSFSQNGWRLATSVNQNVLYHLSESDMWPVFGGSALLAVLAVVLTNILTRRITTPVLDLAEDMQKTGEQGYYKPLPLPDNADGEVKTLYDSYNYLIEEVNQSITNIQEISRKEQENQFMLLQAQINPHFLYNTLNTISWLAQNRQNDDIQAMVVAMVKLFRTSLNNGKPMVTVEQEMDNVTSYLRIMQYRYPEQYEIETDIADDTRELMVIKQILQPLAENALNHGFLEAKRKGVIRITSHQIGRAS
ncbi:MAG: histidine kinase, partial [Erysipelotrichaceae bacterium]|nr:histidine kinase [Erysipelotrichaceae bacterium]